MSRITEKDFLDPLYSLGPYIVAIVILFWGFGTLLLVAIKTKTVFSVLLANPAFIGDLFLLPIAGFLITYFYRSVNNPIDIIILPVWSYVILTIAIILTVVSVTRNELFNIWWIPHQTFYCFFAYLTISFLIKGLLQLILVTSDKALWLVWASVLILVSASAILGIVFPKIFPEP